MLHRKRQSDKLFSHRAEIKFLSTEPQSSHRANGSSIAPNESSLPSVSPKDSGILAGQGLHKCPASNSAPKCFDEFDRRVRACLIQAIEKDQAGSVIIKINHSQESEAVSSWHRLKRSDPLLILQSVRSVSILNDNFSDDIFFVIYLKRGGSNV